MNARRLARGFATAVLGLAISSLLLPEARAAVGRTEAAYGVTPNGAASYTIPIRVTEGINGLTPSLAISYIGPGSRSIFGVGFALSGLSYITPCRKTIAQDLNAAPVTLTSADRYCLDGARLRSISGTYGATNAQYRTELDQLVRVTSLASTNNIPGWFRVEMPNGLEYEYGNSTDSKLLSSGLSGATPQFWALSKISDSNGNSIRFVYDTDAATRKFRPSYVSYTERGGTGHYKISFVYQTSLLPFKFQRFTPSLTGGAAHEQDKLLERIELKHDDVVYRTYKLTYQAGAGDNQRLWKVQECAYAPSEDCLPVTQFTWQSATAGHAALASTSKAVASGVLTLDINGDGIQDLVWAASGTWRYMLGGASGFGAILNTGVTATNPTKAMVLEWNADGFDDLLIDWSDGKWRVLKGGPNGFVTPAVAAGPGGIPSNTANTSWTVSDLDADGRDDLLSMLLNTGLTINVRYNGASGFGAQTQMYQNWLFHTQSKGFIQATGASAVRRPDFNGDARFDLLVYACFWDEEPPAGCIGPYRWYQMMSDGNSFSWEGAIPGATYNIDVRFGDFNSDGLTDIVYPQASSWTVGLGQGSGGFAIVNGPSNTAHATYQTLVGDFDGDGYDDLYVTKNSPFQWEVFRSNGTALQTTPIATSISGTGVGWKLVDQNGDSLPDIGSYNSSSLIWSYGTHVGLPGERLLTAADGLANTISFTYLPMTSATVYAKGAGAVYPMRDFRGSAPLARTMQVSPAGGTSYTFTYKYYDARLHAQGRSFLGMGRRDITDGRNSVFTVETYRQDFPYIGAPATVTVKQSSAGSAKSIQSATNTYNHHVLNPTAGNERYLPYRSQTISNVHEVGGVRNGAHLTKTTETHTVNTWGNSTFVSIEVEDVDSLSPEIGSIYRTEVTSSYVQDSTNWCIGLPLSRDETRKLPDGTQQTRGVDWDVDGAACRVDQEIIQPGGGTLASLITDFGYDICGNVNLITSQPASTTNQQRITQINHGSRCQRPATVTNSEGHVTTFVYNWSIALPNTQTDANGLTTSFEYDGLGRSTRIVRPDATGTRFALTACTSGNNWCGKANGGARVKVTRTERSTSDSVLRTDEQFIDSIGRARWTHTASLESGPAIVETLYDAFNRPTTRTQPYFAGGLVYPTSYAYDLIGRVTSIDAPVSESMTNGRVTGFAYEGRYLKITDPRNFTATRRGNALGQLRVVIDPSPGATTSYAYHPFGELKSITDAAMPGNVTSWSINARGYVIGTSDPDSGDWTYEVNAFGESTKIRDAKTTSPSWTTQFTFDKLSRPLTRVEAEGTTTFTWGTASHNTASNKYIGRLKQVSSPGGYSEIYTFDALARLSKLRTTIDGANWDFDQSYWGSTGLPAVRTYPVSGGTFRLRVINSYQNNLLRLVAEYQGTTTYWEATSTDAWGHVQDETFGNGVTTFTDFDQASGFMDTREAWHGATPLINANVDWDLNGNLTKRQDLLQNPAVTEDFAYDSINRVASTQLNAGPVNNISIDSIGNITAKDGLTYLYTGSQTGCSYYTHTQPRAVRKIGSTVYCYDKNGNMTKRGGSTISYTSYNLPSVINSGSNSSTLSYGAFRNRYKQVTQTSAGTETTLYAAGLFERITRPTGTLEYRHQIPGGNGIAAIHTRINSVGTTYYVHSDHLGSPELITNSSGGAEIRLSFAAYGARRNPATWNGAPPSGDLTKIADTTRAGFTGHEHLDSVGLIHMNGRVYDPAAGRFLGVDPILSVGLSQDVNSYSYAWNRPLVVTDPTGLDEDVTVKRCIDACALSAALSYMDAHGWLSYEPRYRTYDPPAAACIDGYASCNFISKPGPWDGRSHGANGVMYGFSSTVDETRPSISEWLENSRRERAELEALLAMGDGTTPYARSATTSEVADILWPGHELGTCIYDSSTGGGCGFGKWGLAIVGVIPGSKVLLPARAGATVFKTAHYATRLERAGVNVARAESEVAIAIGAMRPNMAESALVSGRMTVDGVLVEYRAMLLPNGTVNVGTIFPVAP